MINLPKTGQAAWHDSAFSNPSDGVWYQARVLAMMSFIQPTIEDELIAHSLGIQLRSNHVDRY